MSVNAFFEALGHIYDEPDRVRLAEDMVMSVCQGKHSAEWFCTEFRRWAAEVSWDDAALRGLFRRGLSERLQDALALHPPPNTLEDAMTQAVRMDRRLRARGVMQVETPLFSSGKETVSEPMEVVKPLTDLTCKGADVKNWSLPAKEAFAALKKCFSTAPVLVQPDPSKPFIVEVDASDVGFTITFRPGSKNVKADALSRSFHPVSPPEPPSSILRPGVVLAGVSSELEREIEGAQSLAPVAKPAESNGQTERTNQSLEQILRCLTSARQNDWCDVLPLAEFAFNSRVSQATSMSPFMINYGFIPHFGEFSRLDSGCPGAEGSVQRLKNTWAEVQRNISRSQGRYKFFADRKRTPGPVFRVGDEVWLSTRNIKLKVPSAKLGPKFIGPYKIVEKINPVAYRLFLPVSFKIPNVFHKSLLKPFVPVRGESGSAAPPVLVEGHMEYEIDHIVDSRYPEDILPDPGHIYSHICKSVCHGLMPLSACMQGSTDLSELHALYFDVLASSDNCDPSNPLCIVSPECELYTWEENRNAEDRWTEQISVTHVTCTDIRDEIGSTGWGMKNIYEEVSGIFEAEGEMQFTGNCGNFSIRSQQRDSTPIQRSFTPVTSVKEQQKYSSSIKSQQRSGWDPANVLQRDSSPVPSLQRSYSPVRCQQRSSSPVWSQQRNPSPVISQQRSSSPASSHQRCTSPIRSLQQNYITPKTQHNESSHLRSQQKRSIESYVKANTNMKDEHIYTSPVRIQQSTSPARTQCPSPARTSLRSTLPASTPLRSTSPARTPLRSTSPARTQLWSTSSTRKPLRSTSPASTPLRLTSPVRTPLRSTSPARTPLRSTSPARTPLRSTSPARTPLRSTSPARTPIRSTSPARTPLSSTSPTRTLLRSSSPAKTPLRSTSPARTPLRSTSPARTPLRSTSPARTLFRSTSPARTPLRSSSPARTPLRSTSPARTPLRSTSPARTPLRSTSPARPSLNPTSPARATLRSTSPARTPLRSTSPARTPPRSTSPVRSQQRISSAFREQQKSVSSVNLKKSIPSSQSHERSIHDVGHSRRSSEPKTGHSACFLLFQ
ncbi:uncharacterized protein [Ranitomeya imitator]|uniref:uncharacterized protein n=1 Tax=Ranitomeya imitator TaxID=111125 RepID=UPI0037E8E7B9